LTDRGYGGGRKGVRSTKGGRMARDGLGRVTNARNINIFFVILTILATFGAIAFTLFLFSNESVSYNSYKIFISKKSVATREELIQKLNTDVEKLREHLIGNVTRSGLSQVIDYDSLNNIKDEKERASETEFWSRIWGDRVIDLVQLVDSYNQDFRENEYVNKDFDMIAVSYYEILFYRNNDKDYPLEQVRKAVASNIANRTGKYDLSIFVDAFQNHVLTYINSKLQQIDVAREEISKLNDSIVEEEARLDLSNSKFIYSLVSRTVVILMGIVVLLTLLSLLRYFINQYNKYHMIVIVIEQYTRFKDHELLRLVLSTEVNFDNKAEELLSQLMKNKVGNPQ
jgi:hypothetical protein